MARSMNLGKLVPPLLALALSACASTSDRYPSLAIRDAERVQGSFEPDTAATPPPALAPPSADLLARLSELRSEAASAHGEFLSIVPRAQRLVASAGGVGSDSWASAQVALASLDGARSKAAVPLGDLDVLFIDATLAAEQREAIGEVRAEVLRLIEAEDETLARLRGRL